MRNRYPGYELDKGMSCEIRSASGCPIPCYIHTLDMMIGEGTEEIKARVAFSTTENTGKGILGRIGCFR